MEFIQSEPRLSSILSDFIAETERAIRGWEELDNLLLPKLITSRKELVSTTPAHDDFAGSTCKMDARLRLIGKQERNACRRARHYNTR